MAVVFLPYGGGLGNLIFYHHTAFAVSKKLGVPMYINSEYHDANRKNIAMYDKIFNHVEFVNRESPILQHTGAIYTEPNFHYDQITVPENTVVFMQGYFQSYKYFWDCMGDIIKQFRTNLGDDFMQKEYDELRGGEKTVCVHVRRTDNITNCAHHTLLGEDYYKNALDHIDTGRLLVFSDDPESIKHWDIWATRDTVFVDETDPVRALWLMSLCDSFVIANSSMSLSAYLMAKFLRNTPCVAPAQWMGPLGLRFKIHDLLPPGTIILS